MIKLIGKRITADYSKAKTFAMESSDSSYADEGEWQTKKKTITSEGSECKVRNV